MLIEQGLKTMFSIQEPGAYSLDGNSITTAGPKSSDFTTLFLSLANLYRAKCIYTNTVRIMEL